MENLKEKSVFLGEWVPEFGIFDQVDTDLHQAQRAGILQRRSERSAAEWRPG